VDLEVGLCVEGVQRVVVVAADHFVGARAAGDRVVPVAAAQVVVSAGARDRVVAARAVDDVGAGAADDDVRAVAAVQLVAEIAADDAHRPGECQAGAEAAAPGEEVHASLAADLYVRG